MQGSCQEVPSHWKGQAEEMEGRQESQHDEEEEQEETTATKTYLCFKTTAKAVEQNAKWMVKVVRV